MKLNITNGIFYIVFCCITAGIPIYKTMQYYNGFNIETLLVSSFLYLLYCFLMIKLLFKDSFNNIYKNELKYSGQKYRYGGKQNGRKKTKKEIHY